MQVIGNVFTRQPKRAENKSLIKNFICKVPTNLYLFTNRHIGQLSHDKNSYYTVSRKHPSISCFEENPYMLLLCWWMFPSIIFIGHDVVSHFQ